MDFQLFVTPGLGDNTYLVASKGEAVLVDPQRDVRRFLDAAKARKADLKYVLETHVHNDYVSGALEVKETTGAEIAVPAKGDYEFPHKPMKDGEEVRVGNLRLAAMDAPGHTPEHIVWIVYQESTKNPAAVFSGGSLIVGSAGRTDLLGPEGTENLTRDQYRTVRQLARLPDEVQVLPTHGAGSFCVASAPVMTRTTTIGAERYQNQALAALDEEAFLRRQLTGLLAYPAYYEHMAPINRRGPKVLGGLPKARALSTHEAAKLIEEGAWVVDGRDRVSFAQAHVPGSINIELDSSFATYVGWVTPFNSPLILVLPDSAEVSINEAVTQLIRIGYDDIRGYLRGGIEAWRDSGQRVSSYPVASLDELCHAYLDGKPIQILDVRQQREWDSGHVPESLHIFLGDLPQQLDKVPKDRELWTACASGYRASIAASILDRAGVPVRVVAQGGVPEWLARCYPLATGARR